MPFPGPCGRSFSRSRSRSLRRTRFGIKHALEIIVGDWVEYKKESESREIEYGDNYGQVIGIQWEQESSPALKDNLRIFIKGNHPEWPWQHVEIVERSKVRFVHRGLFGENKDVQAAGGYREFGK